MTGVLVGGAEVLGAFLALQNILIPHYGNRQTLLTDFVWTRKVGLPSNDSNQGVPLKIPDSSQVWIFSLCQVLILRGFF